MSLYVPIFGTVRIKLYHDSLKKGYYCYIKTFRDWGQYLETESWFQKTKEINSRIVVVNERNLNLVYYEHKNVLKSILK